MVSHGDFLSQLLRAKKLQLENCLLERTKIIEKVDAQEVIFKHDIDIIKRQIEEEKNRRKPREKRY